MFKDILAGFFFNDELLQSFLQKHSSDFEIKKTWLEPNYFGDI